jgi:hypothetical protein
LGFKSPYKDNKSALGPGLKNKPDVQGITAVNIDYLQRNIDPDRE